MIELSERCEAWSLPWFQKLQSKVSLHSGVCKGCQVNLRDEKGQLLKKGWKLVSNSQEQVRHMTLQCTNDHSHGLCEGGKTCRRSAYYTPEFAKRVVNHINLGETFEGLFGELIDGTDGVGWDSSFRNTPKEDGSNPKEGCGCRDDVTKGEFHEENESTILVLSRQERSEIFSKLRRIHSATGHCNREYLVKALQKRGAKPGVLELAKEFKCSVCDEKSRIQPRKQVTLTDIPPKWTRMQSDVGSWVHHESGKCWKFVLAIDEGSRMRVGMILGEGSHRHPSGQEFIDFYNGYWRPCFGKPNSIRLDPDGAWRSGKLDQYFSEQQIIVEHVPTEAHWQISLIERAVQTTQNMMNSLHMEFPEMSVSELFSRCLWAQNTHDQYLGFSPLQHAFGRNPDKQGNLHDEGFPDFPILTEKGVSAEFGNDVKAMHAAEQCFLREQADQRLKRAALSGSRKPKDFFPGDLVFYWRKQVTKNHGASKFGSGKFIGPARVLATETRKDTDGAVRAGSIVWLYRAGRLIKAAPEQLRPASEREEAWNELIEDKPISWTISGILESSERKTFDDISGDWEEKDIGDMDFDLENPLEDPEPPQGPRRRHTFKHPLRQEGEEEQPRRVKARPGPMEDHPMIALASEEPSKFLEEPGACLSVEIELPQGKDSKKKHWMRDFEAFIINQVKKNHVEVHERRLKPEEIELFKAAKSKEVKNFVAAKVFEKIPEAMRPDRSQVLRMRWVLTWKIDPETSERKAKARAVVLGYMDPEYEFRPTSSPTMTRTTRQLFLTMCASYDFRVEKGDVSGAFLQGREYTRKLLCEPLPEICEALSLPAGSVTRLAKAAYGLVEAPIEWYLTISSFLEELGFERQLSDPCCWGLFDKDDLPIGWICGHVDDFMFGGREDDPRWKKICKSIQEKFKWTEWEKNKFTQCGVLVEQLPSNEFLLSQNDFLDQVEEIFIPKKRYDQREEPITEGEKQQMRSVLGCLSWHAGQLAMDLSAPTGLLLSKVNCGTVVDLIETNKVLRKAKQKKNVTMKIHKLPHQEILVATWADAAHANRPDGSSTKGVLIGCASSKLLDGSLEVVNPIFWHSAKISRTCRSSAAAETSSAVDGEDQMYSIRFQLSEFKGVIGNLWKSNDTVKETPGVLVSDSKNLYDRLSQTVLTLKGAEKRSDIETLCLKEAMDFADVSVRWVNGDSQLANSLTKDSEPQQLMLFNSRNGRWKIVYDDECISGRKRKSLGLHPFSEHKIVSNSRNSGDGA